MVDSNRKRGPYKTYLHDEVVEVPKRSLQRYENDENKESTLSRSHRSGVESSDPEGSSQQIELEDERLMDVEDCANEENGRNASRAASIRDSDGTRGQCQQNPLDVVGSCSTSSRGNVEEGHHQSRSAVIPPARMMVHDLAFIHNDSLSGSGSEGRNSDDHEEFVQENEREDSAEAQEDGEDSEFINFEVFIEPHDLHVEEQEPNQLVDAEDRLGDAGDQVQGQAADGAEENVRHPDQQQVLGFMSGHQALWNAIRNQEPFTSPVQTAVNNSPAEILLKILALSEQNKLSFKAFVDVVRLVNSLFESPVIPGTQYLLDKLLLSSTGVVRFFYCCKCSYSFGNIDHQTVPEMVCPECETTNQFKDLTKATYFVLFPVESQLELLFLQKEVWESLVDPKDAVRKGIENFLRDIYDGKCYKDFAAFLPDNLLEKILSCVICTDGSPLFKSSNFSIWPCFLCINELPPLLRMKNLLLVGLWFGNRHPPMDLYLKHVVDHLKPLAEQGFKLKVDENEENMRLFTIACCIDSGARGAVQGINSHAGYYSCNWCLVPGKWVDKMIFPVPEVPPAPRTHEEVLSHARECLSNDQLVNVYGVQFVSPLATLPQFDIVRGMVQDFPHNVPFGIARTFLDEWLHNSKRSFYIGSPDELLVLNSRMENLKPCIEVRRAIRLLKDMAFWKAREFENWILFFSILILLNVLPPKFWTHWTYLVQAVYLLSRESVTHDDVNVAHRLIKLWVDDVERIYGEKFMSHNVHIFSHLAENTSRWGPSWAVSTYCFESAIGNLKNILHAHRGVPHQVHREISYRQAKHVLMNTCQTPRTEVFLESIKSKPNNKTKYMSLEECVLIGMGDDFVPNEEERFLLAESEHDVNEKNFAVYSKIICSRCVYTSDSVAVGKKFNNSVALTTSDSIVIIKKFIMDKATEKVYLFCVEAACNEFLKFPTGIRIAPKDHCVRIITSIGRRLQFLSVNQLKMVCVMTKMQENMYVTPFHNLYNIC